MCASVLPLEMMEAVHKFERKYMSNRNRRKRLAVSKAEL